MSLAPSWHVSFGKATGSVAAGGARRVRQKPELLNRVFTTLLKIDPNRYVMPKFQGSTAGVQASQRTVRDRKAEDLATFNQAIQRAEDRHAKTPIA